MKDYFYLHKSWYGKSRYTSVCVALIEANIKKQMTRDEGLLFIRLKKREFDRKTHERRTKP